MPSDNPIARLILQDPDIKKALRSLTLKTITSMKFEKDFHAALRNALMNDIKDNVDSLMDNIWDELSEHVYKNLVSNFEITLAPRAGGAKKK